MLCQAMSLSEPCYHVFSSHVLTLFSTREAYPVKPCYFQNHALILPYLQFPCPDLILAREAYPVKPVHKFILTLSRQAHPPLSEGLGEVTTSSSSTYNQTPSSPHRAVSRAVHMYSYVSASHDC